MTGDLTKITPLCEAGVIGPLARLVRGRPGSWGIAWINHAGWALVTAAGVALAAQANAMGGGSGADSCAVEPGC